MQSNAEHMRLSNGKMEINELVIMHSLNANDEDAALFRAHSLHI